MIYKFGFKGILPAIISFLILCAPFTRVKAQCDCAYPMIFIHGFTGDATSFDPLFTDANINTAWGSLTDTYDAILNATTQTNAYGADGIQYTSDDDVLVQFVNDPNNLVPGCIYAMDFSGFWNQNPANPMINNSTPSGSNQSWSNMSSTEKQGWAIGESIKAVLAANPTKRKVILVGHSMGGLASREYLQRYENSQYTWWVDPSDTTDGHKVAKVVTLGTPHRGSNLTGFGLGGLFNLDETSEAVRDLRYSYACGFLNLFRCRAPYLFGDMEDPHIDIGYFDNGDTDCDGDYDMQMINSLNSIGSNDPWDGTEDNPAMPLPTNVRYTYYTSTGDFVVADERQWIYSGGNGSNGNFNNGNSIPEPSDGVSHRLTDKVQSIAAPFHTSQTGDLDGVIRAMDEGDYPIFAYDVNLSTDYCAFASLRASIVPTASEYTNSGNNQIDGDWFKFEITTNTPGFDFSITPHSGESGRADFYETAPSDYSNANAPTSFITWGTGSGLQSFSSSSSCFAPGTYYLRITHENVANGDWDSYKFRIDPKPCTAPTNLMATTNPLDATLSWDPVACAGQYSLQWRVLGTAIWNTVTTASTSYQVTGLLPGTDYEYQVSADCGGTLTAYASVFPFSTIACPANLYIPSLAGLGYVPMGVYAVGIDITSDGYIDPTTNVTYEAGQSIELMPGFETGLNANFLAHIVPCMPTPLTYDPTDNFEGKETPLSVIDNLQNNQDILKRRKANEMEYVRKIPQADGSVLIEYNLLSTKKVKMELRDLENKSMASYSKSLTAKSGTGIFKIDMQNFEAGTYIFDFKYEDQIRTIRLVKRPVEEIRRRN